MHIDNNATMYRRRSDIDVPRPSDSGLIQGRPKVCDGFDSDSSNNELAPPAPLGPGPAPLSQASRTMSSGGADFRDQPKDRSFPLLLHEIVSNEETDESIHWLPCGTRFVISDKALFAKTVLPRYFDSRGGTKFTSFTRRLKRWSFQRVSSGPQMGAYFHANFRRGQPDLAHRINYPVKSLGTAARRASTGSCVIDFDSLDISPTPIKTPVKLIAGDLSKLPPLEGGLTSFLSTCDFAGTKAPLPDLTPSFPDPHPAVSNPSVSSRPFNTMAANSMSAPFPNNALRYEPSGININGPDSILPSSWADNFDSPPSPTPLCNVGGLEDFNFPSGIMIDNSFPQKSNIQDANQVDRPPQLCLSDPLLEAFFHSQA